MTNEYKRAEIKGNGDFVFLCPDIKSIFKEGEEFVAVKRWPEAPTFQFMKRSSLLFRGREMK